jgi:hypothetical protein
MAHAFLDGPPLPIKRQSGATVRSIVRAPAGPRRRFGRQVQDLHLDNRLLQRRVGRLSERDGRTCTAALEACLGR